MIATRPVPVWGQQWRSSPAFIVAAVGMALFTDSFVYTFAVPIFPYIIESRLGLDSSYTQRMSFTFISQSALVSVIFSPLAGYLADKHSTKRVWLRSASLVALVGTGMVVSAVSPAVLFIGRFVQALASTVAWVVGYATIADDVKLEHLGKTYGLISTIVAVGTSAGPMISGILFDLGGYWLAWSSAFVVIVLDIVLWFLILERSKESQGKEPSSASGSGDIETAPFLPDEPPRTKEQTGLRFYSTLFRHRRFVCGVFAYVVLAILLSSFDTTLPLHVRDVFGWGSMQSGLLYVALQGPAIPLSVPVGWLKDRLGTRRPTYIGLLLLTPLLWLLGVPGDDRFPYTNEGDRGRILYSVTMALIGLTVLSLNGAGTLEATTAVDEIQSRRPGIFGPKGGYSRAMSMSSMGWTFGAFIGPILTGTLVEKVGYYEMECVLAVICLASSVYTYFDLGARWNPAYGTEEHLLEYFPIHLRV